MIRFNPDAYLNELGQRITSCWGVDAKGIARVSPQKKSEWIRRLSTLCDVVQVGLSVSPSKEFELIHLFYDAVPSALTAPAAMAAENDDAEEK